MKRKHRLWLPAITLLLSATLLGLPIAASEGVEEEREAATTITPVIEAPSSPNASPLAVITPVTEPDTPVVEGEETKPVTTTERTAAVIEVTDSNDEPSNSGWFGSWFQSILDAIGGGLSGLWNNISDGFTSLASDISDGVTSLASDIATLSSDVLSWFADVATLISDGFDFMWDKLATSIENTFHPLGGRDGMMEIIKDGGTQYVSDLLNHSIGVIYDVVEPYGVAVMLLCFCFAIAKGCFSKELSASNSLLQPVLGMVIALAAFALSEEIMSALFAISMNLTSEIADKAFSADLEQQVSKIMASTSAFNMLGYAILNGILELILMLNVAKIALLQAISPLFIGFASGQGTRRFMLNLAKEYGKCCLVPPVTAAYAILTFAITDSTWGIFASIVIGFSIWSVGSKQLDKLFA